MRFVQGKVLLREYLCVERPLFVGPWTHYYYFCFLFSLSIRTLHFSTRASAEALVFSRIHFLVGSYDGDRVAWVFFNELGAWGGRDEHPYSGCSDSFCFVDRNRSGVPLF